MLAACSYLISSLVPAPICASQILSKDASTFINILIVYNKTYRSISLRAYLPGDPGEEADRGDRDRAHLWGVCVLTGTRGLGNPRRGLIEDFLQWITNRWHFFLGAKLCGNRNRHFYFGKIKLISSHPFFIFLLENDSIKYTGLNQFIPTLIFFCSSVFNYLPIVPMLTTKSFCSNWC